MIPSIHASCVAIGEWGVLIRGPSGAGKSSLALRLILDAPRALPPAELVADDRVVLEPEGDGLLARPPERLAGLIEVRGLGLRRLPFRPAVRLALVLDLAAPDAERLPPAHVQRTLLNGCALPRLAPPSTDAAALILAAALMSTAYEN